MLTNMTFEQAFFFIHEKTKRQKDENRKDEKTKRQKCEKTKEQISH